MLTITFLSSIQSFNWSQRQHHIGWAERHGEVVGRCLDEFVCFALHMGTRTDRFSWLLRCTIYDYDSLICMTHYCTILTTNGIFIAFFILAASIILGVASNEQPFRYQIIIIKRSSHLVLTFLMLWQAIILLMDSLRRGVVQATARCMPTGPDRWGYQPGQSSREIR